LILFRCNSEKIVCKQTYGYLASSDSSKTYYSFDITKDGKGQLLESSNTSCSNDDDIGNLSGSGRLCINSGNKHSMNNGDIYSLSTSNISVFSNQINSDRSVIVRSTANAFYLDNYYPEKGVNLFISLKRTEDTSQVSVNGNISNTQLCYCIEEGICTAREGYIKNGNNYYSISTTTASNKELSLTDTDHFVNTCTSTNSNGWKLLSYGKLCLGAESIPFLTAGSSYYIGYESSSFFFIRAITNIFTKETLNGKIKIIKIFY